MTTGRSFSEILIDAKREQKLGAILKPDNPEAGRALVRRLQQSSTERAAKKMDKLETAKLDVIMRERWGDKENEHVGAITRRLDASGEDGAELRKLMQTASPDASALALENLRLTIDRDRVSE
jgi:hypothetical protein